MRYDMREWVGLGCKLRILLHTLIMSRFFPVYYELVINGRTSVCRVVCERIRSFSVFCNIVILLLKFTAAQSRKI